MNDLEAFREFAERIGRPEEPYRESFRDVWHDLWQEFKFTNQEALDLLVEWYETERKGERPFCSPLVVLETYRRPRAWVIFLCWSHHGQPFSPL
jgi:hypothetical protein